MVVLFKGLNQGSVIYALFKGDELQYKEGIIVSISAPRLDTQPANAFPIQTSTFNNVIDVTYSLDGKNYTDTVNAESSCFQTSNPGVVSLITTDKDAILQELRASLKVSEDHLAKDEWHQNRVKQCQALIAKHDKAFAEKKEQDERISKIENNLTDITKVLDRILKKLDK